MNTTMGDKPPGSNVNYTIVQNKSNVLLYLVTALSAITFGLVLYIFSQISTLKQDVQTQITKTNQELSTVAETAKSTDVSLKDLKTNLNAIQQQAGITVKELDKTKSLNQRVRSQERTIRSLRDTVAQKADTTDVSNFREEASKQIGTIAGDITAVKGDMSSARKDIDTTRRDLVDVRDYLTQQIAHNKGELDTLKRKGLRDFYEFDIAKKNSFQKVGDIHLALKRADQKKKNFNVLISVDDNQLEKKNVSVTEPIQFLVGKSRVRYELVVYDVRKDRIIGYLSVPNDRTLAAERAAQ